MVRRRALSIVAGHSVAEIAAIGEEVWDEVLSLRIFPGTHALLDEHLAAGHQVWIITASPVEIGELIGRRLGVTGALGTVAEHVDGFYTGRLVGRPAARRRQGAGRRARSPRPRGSTSALLRVRRLHATTCPSCPPSVTPWRSTPTRGCGGTPAPGRLARPRVPWARVRPAVRRSMHAASWAGGAWVLGLVAAGGRRALRG